METEYHLDLQADPSSARQARDWFEGLPLDGVDVDTGVLLVSELVTNAVLHAGTPMTLTVRPWGQLIRVELADARPAMPRLAEDEDWGSGRGLRLIDRLAARWGAYELSTAPGVRKVVWFELPILQNDETLHPPSTESDHG
jgi:anti-sigma regulatory factor (Ser/Thr protein kinase)